MSFLLPAAPAIAGSTAAAAATTTAFGSTAFWAGAGAAAPIVSSTVVPSLLISSTPSFLSSLSSMYAAVKPYANIISTGLQGVQAINQLNVGMLQESNYRLQNLQLQNKVANDRLNYTRQANEVLRRVMANNASAMASGYAGGIIAGEGSSGKLQDINLKYAGEDLSAIKQNIDTANTFGKAQSTMLTNAADSAVSGSYFDAMATVGKAFYSYSTYKV